VLVENDDAGERAKPLQQVLVCSNSQKSSTWETGSGDENDVAGAFSENSICYMDAATLRVSGFRFHTAFRLDHSAVARQTWTSLFTQSRLHAQSRSPKNYGARRINEKSDIKWKSIRAP
jgi:hypothetical protein